MSKEYPIIEIRKFLHDLRSPITSIKMLLYLIKDDKNLSKENMKILEEENTRLEKLVEDFSSQVKKTEAQVSS